MIEVTEEMIVAFESASDDVGVTAGDTRAGLAAALAIVERDFQVIALCGEELGSVTRCTRLLIPAEGHRGDHEGKSPNGGTVKWS